MTLEPSAPPDSGQPDTPTASVLLRLLVNHNPFYVLSAGLMLHGVHVAGWAALAMLTSLAGYAALMVVTALAIVRVALALDGRRRGRGEPLLQDARSIVVIVVVLLLAISVGLDRQRLDSSQVAGAAALWLGLAMALSEALIQGARARAPLALRLPYHALLALFFLYPEVLTPLIAAVDSATKQPLASALAGWSWASAAMLLTLLPAVRGLEPPPDAGHWWRPSLGWALLGVLTLACGARSWLMVQAFYTGSGDPFAPFLLAPLALAVGALIFARGRAVGSGTLGVLGLLTPALAALACALPAHDPLALELQAGVTELIAAPALVVAIAAAVFYGAAWLTGSRLAEAGLIVCAVVIGGHVSPATLDGAFGGVASSLLVGGLYLTGSCAWASHSWRPLAGLLCLGGAVTIGVGPLPPLASANLLTAWLLPIALLYDDRLAACVRAATLPLLALQLAAVLFVPGWAAPGCSGALLALQAGTLLALPPLLALVARDPRFLALGLLQLGLVAARGGLALVELHANPDLGRHVLPLLWCGVCFVSAVAVSAAKAGVCREVGRRLSAGRVSA